MIYQNEDQLRKGCASIIACQGGDVILLDQASFQQKLIDDLIFTAVFSPNPGARQAAAYLIRRGAAALGILSASIQSLYQALNFRLAGSCGQLMSETGYTNLGTGFRFRANI